MTRYLVVALLAAGACGGGGSGMISSSIGASGGTLFGPAGASVQVPSGALSATTDLTAITASAPAPAAATEVGAAVTFGPEGQTFATPVTVFLTFASDKLPAGTTAQSIVVFTAPAGSSSYTRLTTTVVDATRVSAPVSHFSTFVPGVPICATNSDCVTGVCVGGICKSATACATSADCPTGVCASGLCE